MLDWENSYSLWEICRVRNWHRCYDVISWDGGSMTLGTTGAIVRKLRICNTDEPKLNLCPIICAYYAHSYVVTMVKYKGRRSPTVESEILPLIFFIFSHESCAGMVSVTVLNTIVQISCTLSMLGSALVILTWAYPRKNRTKHGRILLMWLSVADFISSCVYFTQTFHATSDEVCEMYALLGIYFPVASFLWTDCIAYFLYLVVSNRTWYQPYDWPKLLRSFHILVWGLSLLIISLVFAFGHAGYASDDDSNESAEGNTGGWCWIKANSRGQRFLWELIGGKLVEWTSYLFVLPFLYTSVYFELTKVEGEPEVRYTLDDGDRMPSVGGVETVAPPSSLSFTKNALLPEQQSAAPSRPSLGIPKVKSVESLYDMSDMDENPFMEARNSRNSQTATSTTEPYPTVFSGAPTHNTGITVIEPRTQQANSTTSATAKPGLFSKFYLKLAAVPLMLIFIRFWSSLRIVLQYARPHADNADSFFEVMQAFFDPSQGIFNAIVFVFASDEDRETLYLITMRAKRYTLMYLSNAARFLSCGWACCTRGEEERQLRQESAAELGSPL